MNLALVLPLAFLTILGQWKQVMAGNSNKRSRSSSSEESGNEYAAQLICSGFYDDWDPIDTPLDEKDFRGRIRHINEASRMRAISQINYGMVYDLSFTYDQNIVQSYDDDTYETILHTSTGIDSRYYFQSLATNSHGNVGTQLDHFCHTSVYDEKEGTFTDNSAWIMCNGAKESELRSDGKEGFNKGFCVDNVGPIVTTAHLLDVAGYLGIERMEVGEEINETLFYQVLDYQSMSIDDIKAGDVVVFYTGFGLLFETGEYYNDDRSEPGITLDLLKNVFYDLDVAIIGSDNWGVEVTPSDFPGHKFWFVCAGGFFHEAMNLEAWIADARQDNSKYIGAYFYNPTSIVGAPGATAEAFVMV